MSRAKGKVEWCLQKALRELEQSSKHKGLVKSKPSLKGAQEHIAKAEHNFKAALILEKARFPDWSVNAAFYTIYHCLLAIIRVHGYESRNQDCTFALIDYLTEEKKISLSPGLLDALKSAEIEEVNQKPIISLRENYQYGTRTSLEINELAELKQVCRQAIEDAKRIAYA